jgi:enoyl-CoA hydratase
MAKVLFEPGVVSKITINRPEKYNALDAETAMLITKYVKKASSESRCRCIIITGAGDKAFSAGADVSHIAKLKTKQEAGSFFDILYKMRKGITESPKVVIAVINGYCLGGGNELAMACDLRIASTDSIFGQPEAKLGIIPGGGATYTLQSIVGISRAKEIILTGESISAGKALRIGLVNMLCDKRDLMKSALELCESVVLCSPNAVALAKSAINGAAKTDYRYERRAFVDSVVSKEGRMGISAFIERSRTKSRKKK